MDIYLRPRLAPKTARRKIFCRVELERETTQCHIGAIMMKHVSIVSTVRGYRRVVASTDASRYTISLLIPAMKRIPGIVL